MNNLFNGIRPAIGWFLLTTFLLVLPGSAFPKETWLSKIQFDKIVHIGIFAVMVWLFCRAYYQKNSAERNLKTSFIYIAIIATVYGLVMEFVQKYFVPNRSFDIYDVAADAAGALIGYFFSVRMYLKKCLK